jgi:hypothetical protein
MRLYVICKIVILNQLEMKKTAVKIVFLTCSLAFLLPVMNAQEIKSDIVKIHVNTKNTDKEIAADIQVLEPRDLKPGETFLTNLQSVPLVIKITSPAEGLIRIILLQAQTLYIFH